MKSTFTLGLLKLIILICFLSSWSIPRTALGSPGNEVFGLQVVGFSNGGFIGGPCPPNTTCTYDSPGWRDMAFGLTYLGDNFITITSIQLIQTLHFMGQHWNVSNYNQIVSESISLNQGDTFFFRGKGIYTFMDQGEAYSFPIYVKIIDTDENIYWLSMDAPETLLLLTDSEYLSNLPFISTHGLSPSMSFVFLVFILSLYGLKRKFSSE